MKFTNRVKIIVCFGEKMKDRITFYGKGNTEVRGDETHFLITGEFDNVKDKDGKDIARDTE